MPLKIFNKKEKEEILKKLNEQFGIKEIYGELIKLGKEKIFLFQGEISYNELKEIEKILNIERIGIYLAKEFPPTKEIRLSIEGTQILKEQINKRVFEINKEDLEKWMLGQEIQIETGQEGIIVIKHKDDYLGCGKASLKKIGNFIPKSRRLKNKP